MAMHHATIMLMYLLIVCFVVPVTAANTVQTENFINETIIGVVLAAATVMDGCYIEINNNMKCSRVFVKRKSRCVSDIFEELGYFYVLRAYRMNEIKFWKLYNILQKYEHKDSKKGNRRGTIVRIPVLPVQGQTEFPYSCQNLQQLNL